MERATNALRSHGQTVDGTLLQYLTPLGWEHINLTGDYQDDANQGVAMTFEKFCDAVEALLAKRNGWSEIEVADFISPRVRRQIQAYQEGLSIEEAATVLQAAPPAKTYWD